MASFFLFICANNRLLFLSYLPDDDKKGIPSPKQFIAII